MGASIEELIGDGNEAGTVVGNEDEMGVGTDQAMGGGDQPRRRNKHSTMPTHVSKRRSTSQSMGAYTQVSIVRGTRRSSRRRYVGKPSQGQPVYVDLSSEESDSSTSSHDQTVDNLGLLLNCLQATEDGALLEGGMVTEVQQTVGDEVEVEEVEESVQDVQHDEAVGHKGLLPAEEAVLHAVSVCEQEVSRKSNLRKAKKPTSSKQKSSPASTPMRRSRRIQVQTQTSDAMDTSDNDTNQVIDVDIENDKECKGCIVDDELEAPTIYVGKIFRDRDAVKLALAYYCLNNQFEVKYTKCDKARVTARCAAMGCSWRIHSSRLQDGFTFKVKKLHDKHSCSFADRSGNHMASINWIAKHTINWLRSDPSLTVKQISDRIFDTYSIRVPYMRLYRGKNIALEKILEDAMRSEDKCEGCGKLGHHIDSCKEPIVAGGIQPWLRDASRTRHKCKGCGKLGHHITTCKEPIIAEDIQPIQSHPLQASQEPSSTLVSSERSAIESRSGGTMVAQAMNRKRKGGDSSLCPSMSSKEKGLDEMNQHLISARSDSDPLCD